MDELLKDDLIRVTKRCNLFRFIHVISDGGEFETTFKDIYPEELELNNEKFRSPQGIIFGLHVLIENRKTTVSHCVKNARIRSYYGPHFPVFGLNTLRIRSECGKIWTRITPNTDTFYAVNLSLKKILSLKKLSMLFYKCFVEFISANVKLRPNDTA